jgi:hypothetical protein
MRTFSTDHNDRRSDAFDSSGRSGWLYQLDPLAGYQLSNRLLELGDNRDEP